jgi:hypothetical protein
MMAVWPSAPPSSVATPAMRAGSSSAASAGVSASATRMEPSGTSFSERKGVAVRFRISRRAISRISAARRYKPALSSSLAARMAAAMASASSSTAVSAAKRSFSIRLRAPRSSRELPSIIT